MHATSPRRGLAHPALLLVGLTAAGAFLLGQRSAVAQDPAPPNPAVQRLEMIRALQSIQAGQAAILEQMQQQTASLKQIEKIDGAILRLVHGELQPKPVDPHGHGLSTPGPTPVDGSGPR